MSFFLIVLKLEYTLITWSNVIPLSPDHLRNMQLQVWHPRPGQPNYLTTLRLSLMILYSLSYNRRLNLVEFKPLYSCRSQKITLPAVWLDLLMAL